MAQKKFGGVHTSDKLRKLENYLKAYLSVFKNQSWANTIYIDAFAGTGQVPAAAKSPELPIDFEGESFIVGSAHRALGLEQGFQRYVFIEKKRKNVHELRALVAEFPERAKRSEIIPGDANQALQKICRDEDWSKTRAVVFLDPFGSQVEWQTIKSLAATKAVDLWYLFPAGASVARQVRNRDGTVHESHEKSLDRILGTTEWRLAFSKEQDALPDLFNQGGRTTIKNVTPESATLFMIQRLRSVFAGGVCEDWLPLGSNNVHWYSLLFAWANPSQNAKKAGNIASSVLRSSGLGRRK